MKLKFAAAAVMMCLAAVSCGSKTEVNYSGNKETPTGYKDLLKANFADIPDAETGPVISVSNTSAKAGDIAEITVSVEGANENWDMCGIHITYPNVLSPVIDGDDNDNYMEYKAGEAVEENSGFIVLNWVDNIPEELAENNLGSFFFTTMFDGNLGKDGDIATFYIQIPENAESGTVYPIGMYYMTSDMFRNSQDDKSFSKYAFEHFQEGSITVE